ncbi:type I-E CRISPR-associated protein Cas6/Cse3/CasE [Acaryochloris marina]|uniref:type I-E CRISPR-associated protein Cas6/Cse3/CasE n=1 Tax=Acaryochloris marina TaxID=155978 RepID=UPI0021C40A2B|nr:type I-E CRISPR-associated protein Cas6/Cse3/CasE [Acaryochloris marina]BDM82867.1 type I-E CRISPR-associated protein Cas6/Cse3/CasE [Acaryochloris marina MBIC10699]
MFLSQLILNEQARKVQRDLGNAHHLHRQIMQAFPDKATQHKHEDWYPRQEWHILFRQEPDSNIILVQSSIEPDWTHLPEKYLQQHITKPIHYVAEQFQSGRVLQFRLRANPSKRDKETRKTVGLCKQVDQLAWLERQSQRCGFQLHNTSIIPSPNVFGLKGKGSAPIRIKTVLYQGILQVTDAISFTETLCQGLGRGKSYGCGLLSVSRYLG